MEIVTQKAFVMYYTLNGHTISGVSVLSECKAYTRTKEKHCLYVWHTSNIQMH
jgi:hypothetical protein